MKNSNLFGMKLGGMMLLGFSLAIGNATAQEPRIDNLPDSPSPQSLGGGARWLQQSLLAPLLKQTAAPAKPQKEAEPVAPEVKELSNVHDRIGSVVKGSFLDSIGEPTNHAEKQRIWAEMTKKWRAEGAPITQRVSDEAGEFNSSLPVFNPYTQSPIDPTQAAVEQLRGSARNLDQAAADLEDAGKYSAADRLRATAQRLRREAREFSALQETPTQEAAITR